MVYLKEYFKDIKFLKKKKEIFYSETDFIYVNIF